MPTRSGPVAILKIAGLRTPRVRPRPRAGRRSAVMAFVAALGATVLGPAASPARAVTTVTVPAAADAQVSSSNPATNYGTLSTLRVREGAGDATSPIYRTYLEFSVSGLSGPVTGAALRLYVTDPSTDGGSVYGVDPGWTEGAITYANAPIVTGSPVGSAGPVVLNAFADIALSPASIPGNGTYAFALKSARTDSAIYSSREGTQPPRLILTVGAPPPPPAPPIADFVASPTTGAAPLTTAFSDRSTGSPTSWSWDFGDPTSGGSNTSSLASPGHAYGAAGSYTVSLTVSNTLGTDTKIATNLIVVNPAPPPATSLAFGPTGDAQVSSAGPTKNYGATTTLRVREGAGTPSSPIYRTYLKFSVSGVTNAVTSAKLRLYVADASVDGGAVYAVDPGWSEGSITFSNAPPIGGTPLSSGGPAAVGTYREIELGAAAVPNDGTYAFALRSASTDSAIYASRESASPRPQLVLTLGGAALPPPPVAEFTGSPTSGPAPLTVAFVDASTGGPATWSWDFGDGATSGLQTPTHIYPAAGTYSVSLRVTNAGGLGTRTRTGYISVAPPPASPPGDPVLVGAGDIADCALTSDDATATLLDGIPGTVFTAGDDAYDNGTPAEFSNCYGPTWGRVKSRTLPAVGNHDYGTAGAAGYFGYFGSAAGDPTKGWYSTDIGTWHLIVLNSNCIEIGGCGVGSSQELWLKADLAAHPATCTAAIWHHPRFSSGNEGSSISAAFWQDLYDANADVVINGHEHFYERYAPQDPAATADAARGIRQFIAGTGGRDLRTTATVALNSEVRDTKTFGVLRFTLHAASYDWSFLPVAGQTFTDSGTGNCH